jgi:hypothetical protein
VVCALTPPFTASTISFANFPLGDESGPATLVAAKRKLPAASKVNATKILTVSSPCLLDYTNSPIFDEKRIEANRHFTATGGPQNPYSSGPICFNALLAEVDTMRGQKIVRLLTCVIDQRQPKRCRTAAVASHFDRSVGENACAETKLCGRRRSKACGRALRIEKIGKRPLISLSLRRAGLDLQPFG